MSHPTWVRGLKQFATSERILRHLVAPYVGAWIETLHSTNKTSRSRSHPTWVRGLKLGSVREVTRRRKSHPTWVRGLKLIVHSDLVKPACVAPYVGAWIETGYFVPFCRLLLSHPTWVRGLKRIRHENRNNCRESHPTWVRGLKRYA